MLLERIGSDMGKREWVNEIPVVDQLAKMAGTSEQALALWAVVERLEALVAIGDMLEEVGDLWANTLAFGGQPVGEATPMEAFEKMKPWQCDKGDCVLMRGHSGDCAPPPTKHCQCVVPLIDGMGICARCSFPGGD